MKRSCRRGGTWKNGASFERWHRSKAIVPRGSYARQPKTLKTKRKLKANKLYYYR